MFWVFRRRHDLVLKTTRGDSRGPRTRSPIPVSVPGRRAISFVSSRRRGVETVPNFVPTPYPDGVGLSSMAPAKSQELQRPCYPLLVPLTACKLLVLRAVNPWAQGVIGSNPIAPTSFLPSFNRLRKCQNGSLVIWVQFGSK